MPSRNNFLRWATILLSIGGLCLLYLFQKEFQSWFAILGWQGYALFLAGRVARFIVNDMLMILLIYGIFQRRDYVIFAFYVQLAGILLILTPYLIIKYFTTYNGPLVSFLHRLVINPLLMILLIPAFFYQESIKKENN